MGLRLSVWTAAALAGEVQLSGPGFAGAPNNEPWDITSRMRVFTGFPYIRNNGKENGSYELRFRASGLGFGVMFGVS